MKDQDKKPRNKLITLLIDTPLSSTSIGGAFAIVVWYVLKSYGHLDGAGLLVQSAIFVVGAAIGSCVDYYQSKLNS